MVIPCPVNAPCIDDASSLGNYTSELPDVLLFRSFYFKGQIWNSDFPSWHACHGLCTSSVSQADADLCAFNNSMACTAAKQFLNATTTCWRYCNGSTKTYVVPEGLFTGDSQAQVDAAANQFCTKQLDALCGGTTPPPILPPPPPTMVTNDEQTCIGNCPVGGRTSVVPAGYIYGAGKTAANMLASDICELRLTKIGCITDLPEAFCIGTDIGDNSFVLQYTEYTGPYTWAAFGTLPPGLTLEFTAHTGRLYGTTTTAGTYAFQLTVTDSNGSTSWRPYTIEIMEITTAAALPVGERLQPYTTTIAVSGGLLPHTFQVAIFSALPSGLSIDWDTGVISGTPQVAGNYTFSIEVQDSRPVPTICIKEFTVRIKPILFEGLVWACTQSQITGITNILSSSGSGPTFATSAKAGVNLGDQGSASSQSGAFVFNNPYLVPVQCQLSIQAINGSPEIANSSRYRLERWAPGWVDIIFVSAVQPNGFTSPGGIIPFTLPVGGSTLYITIISYAVHSAAGTGEVSVSGHFSYV